MRDTAYRVGFVVDHPTRDMPGALLLARELAARDIETAIVPLYEQGIDVPLLKLDAVVVNYARPVNLELVQNFAASGISVFVLDTEGGVLSDKGHSTPQHLASYIRESGYSAVLSGYFFWGPVLHQAFRAQGVLAQDLLHLTGCPRFDLYAPMWRNATEPRRQGHILVNTNYPLVNPRFVKVAGDDREAIRAVGYEDDEIDRLLRDTRAVMDAVITTVKRLANDMPDRQFILRPHPFENADTYRIAFADSGNVVVDPEGPVFEALHGSHAMLHLNCGTAIEAIMLQVPPLALEFLNVDGLRNHASLPSRASLGIHSYEELLERLLSDAPASGFDFAARYDKIAEPYFYRNDGLAASRVADALEKECRGKRNSPQIDFAMSLASSRRKPRPLQRLQSGVANVFGSQAAAKARSIIQANRRGKNFDTAEIAEALARMARHRNEDQPITRRAPHPVTGLPLASVLVLPAPRAKGASC